MSRAAMWLVVAVVVLGVRRAEGAHESKVGHLTQLYCDQLGLEDLVDRHVVITPLHGPHSVEGTILEVQPGTVIIRPGPFSEDLPPLYEGGKIMEPGHPRMYINCAHIFSVTESQ
jgi:hypothetical protein